MPVGANILHVGLQTVGFTQKMCMWVELEPDNKLEERLFAVYGTGQELALERGKHTYLGTTMPDDFLVWHLYEIEKK